MQRSNRTNSGRPDQRYPASRDKRRNAITPSCRQTPHACYRRLPRQLIPDHCTNPSQRSSFRVFRRLVLFYCSPYGLADVSQALGKERHVGLSGRGPPRGSLSLRPASRQQINWMQRLLLSFRPPPARPLRGARGCPPPSPPRKSPARRKHSLCQRIACSPLRGSQIRGSIAIGPSRLGLWPRQAASVAFGRPPRPAPPRRLCPHPKS
jgi:hypothetical protein